MSFRVLYRDLKRFNRLKGIKKKDKNTATIFYFYILGFIRDCFPGKMIHLYSFNPG